MRTKDFIYYASAAVLMAVTTQVASADEVATQMPTVTEGNQYQPATAADIFGDGAVLAQESPAARPSLTVAETSTATSEVTNSSAPQVSQASSTTIVASESRVVASESVVQANTLASSENASVSTASEVSSNNVAEPAKLTHASGSSYDTDVLKPKASLSIENNNKVTGTFDAVIRNIVAPLGVKEVLIPSWSLANGQDDLVWHKASKQADGSYRVTIKSSDHKHSTGKYRADVYLVDKDDNRQYLTETVVEVNETKPSGSISILNNNGAGTFEVVISDVYSPKGVRTVQVPVWSEADGQDDIHCMNQMIAEYKTGSEIVYGVRDNRDTDSAFKRITAEGFYKVMQLFGADVVFNHADYRLVSKRFIHELAKFKEVNLFLRGIMPLVGFKYSYVTYKRHERIAGESHYPLSKMLGLAIDGITSLSIKPIRIITAIGVLTSFFSFALIIWVLWAKFSNNSVAGWASTYAIVSLLGGVQLISLGVIGEYIGKIYLEAKERPRYIIGERTYDENE